MQFFFKILVFALTFSAYIATAQTKEEEFPIYYTMNKEGVISVHLPDIIVMPKAYDILTKKKVPRRYRKGTRAYNRTIRNLKVTYPLAKKAAKKINAIEKHLQTLHSEKERKQFLKAEYKALIKQYKKPMMNLKISQGKMLMVLIDRETGHTSYEHIKEFKGGFTAFFWQNMARLFGHNLKKPYNPNKEHRYLEHLIQQYERGEL